MAERKESFSPELLLELPENKEYKEKIEEFLLHRREEITKCLPEWWCEKCNNSIPQKIEAEIWDISSLKKDKSEKKKEKKEPPARSGVAAQEIKKPSVRCDRAENCWIIVHPVTFSIKGKNKHIGTVCKHYPHGKSPVLDWVREYMENPKRGFIPIVLAYKNGTYDTLIAKLPW